MHDRPVDVAVQSPSAIWRRIGGSLRELGGGIVEGEVQACKRAPSGHVYLDLVDDEAKVACVIWKDNADAITTLPVEGQLIQARFSRVRTYPKGGSVSLEVNAIRAAGEGELLRRVQETLARLVADGLTDPARKPALPAHPRRIGLVTGRASDAEADVLRAIWDRYPPARITVCHALVQGVHAVSSVVDALATLDADPAVDVIVLARGGGSVEDLLPFSDERLCRAIAALDTPVVTSIGHTRQRPNCDHVAAACADVPGRAAELVVPSADALRTRIAHALELATGLAHGQLRDTQARIHRSAMRPAGEAVIGARASRIELAGRTLDHRTATATAAVDRRLRDGADVLRAALADLPRPDRLDGPRAGLEASATDLAHRLALGHAQLAGAHRLIRARDWRERGFALVRGADGTIVHDARTLTRGQRIIIQLKGGSIDASIEAVHPEETEPDA